MSEVREYELPISIEHLRGLVSSLTDNGWKSATGVVLRFSEVRADWITNDPTRAEWVVSMKKGTGIATIDAYAIGNNLTRVKCRDAFRPGGVLFAGLGSTHTPITYSPIGQAFVEFADFIAGELQEVSEGGTDKPDKTTNEEKLPSPAATIGRYGTHRDLTEEDVRSIVRRCRSYQQDGGTVEAFHELAVRDMSAPRSFALDTLRDWLKKPKFRDED